MIAGAGTCAKELIEEVGQLDHIFVCVGGGGLLAGCAIATRELSPGCKIHGVEPLASDDIQQSMKLGRIVRIPPPNTIADGAACVETHPITFNVIQKKVDDIITVTDDQLVQSMKYYS